MFGSILPISLQQIEYEKLYAVISNELAKSYTMKPISIFIDQLKYDLWEFSKNRPFFHSILPISLQKIAHVTTYVVQSNELAEGYTLIPVTIFRVAGWGEFD